MSEYKKPTMKETEITPYDRADVLCGKAICGGINCSDCVLETVDWNPEREKQFLEWEKKGFKDE